MYWQTVDDNDDGEVGYPYGYDEHGFHLVGQWHVTEHWYLSLGHNESYLEGRAQLHSGIGLALVGVTEFGQPI